jgi:hypoxanthine-DNA glycosylase
MTCTARALRGFPPVAARSARVLILGSMPGAASLAAQRYYAHPRNQFWAIVGSVTGAPPELPYARRLAALRGSGIALWDVIASCRRRGSLDAAIDAASLVVNDFAGFFAQHPGIGSVLFNGATAATLFRRLVLPTLGTRGLELVRLPSTSPAHAGMSHDRKLAAWRGALLHALARGAEEPARGERELRVAGADRSN